ncbi:MAG: FxsA family protein [Propionibacteriaceae bacterium]|nr:FxsA family protein [Propionibacteriaceae bacterium]
MAEQRRGPRPGIAILWLIVPGALFVFAEITCLIAVASHLGWWTLALIAATTLVGAWLLQREGRRTWQALSRSMSSGALPPGQTADAALVMLGGFMLIAPGFLSDVVGLLFLLPFTRPLVRSLCGRLVGRVMRTQPNIPTVLKGEVVEESTPVTLIPEVTEGEQTNKLN